MTTKYGKKEIEEARQHLLTILKPGSRIYTQVVHVSRSGMYRVIDLYAICNDQPVRLSGYAAKLLEGYDERHEGCRASGCGMDMGFHLVHNLGYALFPNGYDCIGEDCPSNDHVNSDRENYPRGACHHTSGGYAFRQEWM